MTNFSQFLLSEKHVFFDGAMGTMLHKRGLTGDSAALNLTHGTDIVAIHAEYIQAGAQIITANTFGAYAFKYENFAKLIVAAHQHARTAAADNVPVFIAHDMGPTGLMLEPYGDVTLDDVYDVFYLSASQALACGADLILIETFMDIGELEMAVKAAKTTNLPIIATMSFNENGRTMYGASVQDMVELLESYGVAALGFNCGFGPVAYKTLSETLLKLTQLPVILQPNAGLPEIINDALIYNVDPEAFAELMLDYVNMGIKILGGCCGTQPKHIEAMIERCRGQYSC